MIADHVVSHRPDESSDGGDEQAEGHKGGDILDQAGHINLRF
jgi:transposase-like protein